MSQSEWVLVLGMMLVTFIPRYLPMLIVGRITLPERLFRALRYVPVAVLTAILVPEALVRDDALTVSLSNAHLYASIIAVLIAWRTRNLLLTIVGGLLIFFLWRALFIGGMF
ncbi:MAG: AzlD domain-containing protein [Anaerolineae bacterium]